MTYLSAIMVLFCFLHRREAFIPVVALVLFNTLYSAVSPCLGDTAIYLAAGAFDVLFISIISSRYWRHEYSLDLCVLSLLSIACNLIGFLMYNAYQSPYLYDAASITIMMLQLMRLLVERNGGDTTGGKRLSMVRLFASAGSESNYGKDRKKEGRGT